MCSAVHQVGLVGGEYFGSKTQRLEQLLRHFPVDDIGAVVVFADRASVSAVAAVVEGCRDQALRCTVLPCSSDKCTATVEQGARRVATPFGRTSGSTACGEPKAGAAAPPPLPATEPAGGGGLLRILVATSLSDCTAAVLRATGGCRCVVNYDLPATGHEYLGRLAVLSEGCSARSPRVVYTIVDEKQVESRRCGELRGLLRRAQRAASTSSGLGGTRKAVEFDAALKQLAPEAEDEEEDEEEEEETDGEGIDDGACDCPHCSGGLIGSMSYHVHRLAPAGVEVVRVSLRGLADMAAMAPLIAPRRPDHVCTLICLHMLNWHQPWDGWEHHFAPPGFAGTIRVVMVLADGCSWHHYPDQATIDGGVPWLDMLDMGSMDRSDALLERLVEHEVGVLGGRSERVVLMGISQGGGQSMLRFLRSRRRLGGWIGVCCHAPIAPHTPRGRDPLQAPARPTVNCGQPMRLLAGESDAVFPPTLVLQDVARLRDAGFTDVEVEVRKGLHHNEYLKGAKVEGGPDADVEPALRRARKMRPELFFIQRHLPSMVLPTPPETVPHTPR